MSGLDELNDLALTPGEQFAQGISTVGKEIRDTWAAFRGQPVPTPTPGPGGGGRTDGGVSPVWYVLGAAALGVGGYLLYKKLRKR